MGWRISVGYLGASMVTALLLGVDPIYTILAGSIMFAALFMATDMVTSPVGRSARLVYGIGCGVLTVLIRELTLYPEGTTFAVLIMNGATPLIDVHIVDTFFGEVTRRGRRIALWVATAAVVVLAIGTGWGAGALDDFTGSLYADGTTRRDRSLFFPDARFVAPYESERPGVRVEQVFTREEQVGYLVYSSQWGYKSRIRLVTALDMDERVIGLRIVDHDESATLGALVRRPSFLNQFLRRSTSNPEAVVDSLEAISGATVSSRAVATALGEALSFRIAPEPPAGRLQVDEDGVFEGAGAGYNGRISVEVTVEGGEIVEISVLSHSETPGIGGPALERIAESVLASQSLDVDIISGATATSRGMINAIGHAIGER
ncbi:MAG: FMN-binding protein [Spirochaetaceae bacterium]|nr:MAG: FMN-binding protein [Spirochaetaceae bacterium]